MYQVLQNTQAVCVFSVSACQREREREGSTLRDWKNTWNISIIKRIWRGMSSFQKDPHVTNELISEGYLRTKKTPRQFESMVMPWFHKVRWTRVSTLWTKSKRFKLSTFQNSDYILDAFWILLSPSQARPQCQTAYTKHKDGSNMGKPT